MDSHDSDIIFVQEVCEESKAAERKEPSFPSQINGQMKDEERLSYHGDDYACDVPDFDDADLEVLDCWEDIEEENPNDAENRKNIDPNTQNHKISPVYVSTPSCRPISCEEHTLGDSNETIILEDLTRLDDISTSNHATSSSQKVNKEKRTEKISDEVSKKNKVKEVSKKNKVQEVSKKNKVQEVSKKNKVQEVSKKNKVQEVSKKNKVESVVSLKGSNVSSKIVCDEKTTPSKQTSRKSHDKQEETHSSLRNSRCIKPVGRGINQPTDSTERKVDHFLKEIALQHPNIIGLQNVPHHQKLSESLSGELNKHASQATLPCIDLSDIPPGVDLEQVSQDSSTHHLVTISSKLKQGNSLFEGSGTSEMVLQNTLKQGKEKEVTEPSNVGRITKPSKSSHVRSDVRGKKDTRRSRSPHVKVFHPNRSRSPPSYKGREVSPSRSFSLSPSPSPRSRLKSRSPLPTQKIPSSIDFNYSHGNSCHKYSDRLEYGSPSTDRSRYYRSPNQETAVLRELSRSLSRERLKHRSRSRSRGKSFARRRSRSRNRYSLKEDSLKRHRRTSMSRSPTWRRSRSRSSSWSPHRYVRKRSGSREESRSKRQRVSRSISRGPSPWKSRLESTSNEWHGIYPDDCRTPVFDGDGQLEQDMARFIATNMAATGIRPPVTTDRRWFEPEVKSSANSSLKYVPVIPDPPVVVERGMQMPLPPPPPDISELMTAEEIKATNPLDDMSPEISLSSLLESAVSDNPEKKIIERCHDAILKLHDVSFKPGRFAVISSLKVPQAQPSSTFQPWQSVLNRSLASKIHFSICIPSEQPKMWESAKPKPNEAEIAAPVPPSLPMNIPPVPSSSAGLDRTALIDKIFFLSRELQELRKALDQQMLPKRHIATQTTQSVYCDNCSCNNNSSEPSSMRSVTSPAHLAVQQKHLLPQHASPSQPVPKTQPLHMSVPQPEPVLQHMSAPQPVPVSQRMSVPQPVPIPQQLSAPQPLPACTQPVSSLKSNPVPTSVPAPQPVPAPVSTSASKKQQQCIVPLGEPLGSLETSGNSSGTGGLLPRPPAVSKWIVNPATSKSSTVQSSNNQLSHSTRKPLNEAKSTAKKKNVPPQKDIPPLMPVPAVLKKPLIKSDFDLNNYMLMGDEHMLDLGSYLQSVGFQVKCLPHLCSPSHSVSSLLKDVIGKNLHNQLILMVNLYNDDYSQKLLIKFLQLIGYLRKRCSHLVVMEPPPLPKLISQKSSWQTFVSSVEKSLTNHISTGGVSVVHCRPFLLQADGTPNNALYANPGHLGINGLKLVAERLQRVIQVRRSRSYE